MHTISYEDSLSLQKPVYIDVRSPREYREDHIPGAVNIPIFDDAEHADVGTLYKTSGQDAAVTLGSRIVGSKLGDIVSRIQEISKTGIPVIYCFRGGMRSSSLVALLESLEFSEVYQLQKGYKGYRTHVLRSLESIGTGPMPQLFVLQGLTGTGKTEILHFLDNAVDLEGIAGHRSSVFGGIGKCKNSQKYFESLLLDRIKALQSAAYMVIEGEAKKIGNCHVPQSLFSIMQCAPTIYITAPMPRRTGIIRREYSDNLDEDEVKGIVDSLDSRIGHKNTVLLREYIDNNKLDDFIELLLTKYYDPLYHHALQKREFCAVIENLDSEEAARKINEIIAATLSIR
jgi:tRNA 2-selenouridine synthase